jgi:tripartite-type tricarboxylate transporter receptor subunit TctC
MVHVPFRGSADAIKDVASGNIEVTLATQASVASFAEAGLVRIVAVAAPRRLSTLADVPTVMEAGFPGVELSNWFGIMAPRGIAPELATLINQAFNKAAALPDVQMALVKQGIEPVRQTPDEFAVRLNEDGKAYQRTIEQVGLAPK